MSETGITVEEQLRSQREQLQRGHSIRMLNLLKGLHDRLGEPFVEALADLSAEKAQAQWREIAGQQASHTIEDLIALLWEPLRPNGFEFTVEAIEGGVRARCTRCPQAEMARQVEGAAPLLYAMTCGTDPAITAAFNPRIGLRRTKTLMQSDDCCEFYYFYLDEPGK